jgi:uncharacterized membrane protein
MEKIIPLLLTSLCILASLASGGVITDGDWPLPGHDLAHSGYSNASSAMSLDKIGLLHTFEEKGDLSSPVTADINGDGKAEILVGSSDNTLYALDYEARVLWSYKTGGKVGAPAVFDLMGNNKTEILFGSKDGIIYALDSDGNKIWSYQTNGSIDSTPIAVNIDYTPQLEVLAASDDKNLYILNYAGEKIRTHIMSDAFLSTICVADINLDEKPDFFMGDYNNRMDSLISPENIRLSVDTGGQVPVPVYAASGIDGEPRIIIASGEGKIYSLVYSESVMMEGDQKIKYSSLEQDWTVNLSGEVTSSPALSDLDGDGFQEVIAGTSGKVVYILNPLGEVMEKHSVNGKILASPVTADLDGDGLPEIVIGSSDGILHVLNASGFRKWSYETKNLINQPPAISDLDRDGNLEIILSAANKLYVYGEKNSETDATTTTTTQDEPKYTIITTATTTNIGPIPSSTTTTPEQETMSSTASPTTTTTTTTYLSVATTAHATTTTLYKDVAAVGFNDFVLFMLTLVLMFIVVGAIAKILHRRFTTLNSDKLPEGEKQEIIPPGPEPIEAQPQSPVLAAEESTVKEYKEALDTLLEKQNNQLAELNSAKSLPAIDEEHKEFADDLKTLEKESKRKY